VHSPSSSCAAHTINRLWSTHHSSAPCSVGYPDSKASQASDAFSCTFVCGSSGCGCGANPRTLASSELRWLLKHVSRVHYMTANNSHERPAVGLMRAGTLDVLPTAAHMNMMHVALSAHRSAMQAPCCHAQSRHAPACLPPAPSLGEPRPNAPQPRSLPRPPRSL
jgi:hypothetical protein